jgi:hypothetical protein
MNLTVNLTFIESARAVRGRELGDVVVRCRVDSDSVAHGITATVIEVLGRSFARDAGHALVGLVG